MRNRLNIEHTRIVAGVTAASLICAGQASAETVKLAPDQRSKINQHVLETNSPVTITGRPVVGAKLPTNVQTDTGADELGPIGRKVQLRAYAGTNTFAVGHHLQRGR